MGGYLTEAGPIVLTCKPPKRVLLLYIYIYNPLGEFEVHVFNDTVSMPSPLLTTFPGPCRFRTTPIGVSKNKLCVFRNSGTFRFRLLS